ncbi:hypothetical protein DPMN_159667 [Dreissena polymorpha]|uniref:Uncharacterized protein n=1 Tax=Dreissena polymorpha TaxID=45954 RepID=A0A9D4ELD1_DREPO|nr:hypothetical protein DPMN_159667 [Dreissena polymorpha]
MKTMSREQLEDIIMVMRTLGLYWTCISQKPGVKVDTIHLRVPSHQTGVCVSEMQRNANPGRANMLGKGA